MNCNVYDLSNGIKKMIKSHTSLVHFVLYAHSYCTHKKNKFNRIYCEKSIIILTTDVVLTKFPLKRQDFRLININNSKKV